MGKLLIALIGAIVFIAAALLVVACSGSRPCVVPTTSYLR